MSVLDRDALESSPLADLHAIATELSIDGFRRLRKADLIERIIARQEGRTEEDAEGEDTEAPAETPSGEKDTAEEAAGAGRRRRSRRGGRGRTREADGDGQSREAAQSAEPEKTPEEESFEPRGRGGRSSRAKKEEAAPAQEAEEIVEGVVELLGNGSAFLRISPPEVSDEDVYISAAQVRRCELVSGDRVSGPVRTRRASERYPSLARIDTINGAAADSVAEGTRYEDLPVAYPSERLELDGQDPTLSAIEWLTPIGRGSRALIVGAPRAGKTETLRRMAQALDGREGLEVMVVLSGVRPEEIAAWREDSPTPAAALNLASSPDVQGQTVEHVVETAKRVAARGGDVVVLIDSLDGVPVHVARRVLAGARNLQDGGSLTLIATATRPFGGETTVVALDVALTSTGRLPALDLAASGTVRPELLVGEDGAVAITKARAAAIGGG
jgi:transcription termination factor Rho